MKLHSLHYAIKTVTKWKIDIHSNHSLPYLLTDPGIQGINGIFGQMLGA